MPAARGGQRCPGGIPAWGRGCRRDGGAQGCAHTLLLLAQKHGRGWEEAGAEIRVLCSGGRGGTESAQPRPHSAGRAGLQLILLPRAPPSTVCVLLLYAPSHLHLGGHSKTRLVLKRRGEKPKQQRPQRLCGMPGAPRQPPAHQRLLLQHQGHPEDAGVVVGSPCADTSLPVQSLLSGESAKSAFALFT